MRTLQIQPDNTLKDIETGEIITCWREADKPPCKVNCNLYSVLKSKSWTKCFCLKDVMGLVKP